MNYWYSCRPDEIFLDLDSTRALARAVSVLRCAKQNRQLQIRAVWLYPTKQEHHAHMIVQLKNSVPIPVRIAWSLWMGSDRLRAAYALARMSDRLADIELFCTTQLYYRKPDSSCQCLEKHKPQEVTEKCPAMRALLGAYHSADYFARTGSVPPRRKIRLKWGRVPQQKIMKWKD